MKHWFDLTDEERAAMTEDEKCECIRKSGEHELEMLELLQAGLWVQSRYQTLFKLPNCHDFGIDP